jgi:hypothetical protein
VVVWEHSETSLLRQLARADDIGDEAARAHSVAATGDPDALEAAFPPRPGGQCGWCDYLAHCPAGQAAAPSRNQPWAGLPLEVTSSVDDVVA